MMKFLKYSIIAILSIALIVGIIVSYFVLPFTLPDSLPESRASVDKENATITLSENEIKILHLTDLHVNGKIEMPMVFSIIKEAVMKSEPDLIVITGDIFSSGCGEEDVFLLCDFLSRLQIPWAPVLGNHDDETPFDLEELSQILESSEGSLFKRGNLTDRYGNYYYYLSFPDGRVEQLIFMDSRSAGFTEESVAFYEEAIEDSVRFGDDVENLLFYHIPLEELSDAVEAYEKDSSIGSGSIGEPLCLQSTSVGFFDKVLELGRTKAMIFGHDHYNNTIIKYLGVDFCYGTKTGIAGGHNFRLGGNLITLDSSGEYSIKRLLHWNND